MQWNMSEPIYGEKNLLTFPQLHQFVNSLEYDRRGFIFFFIGKYFVPIGDLNLEPPTNPPIPLPLEPGLTCLA